MSDALDDRDDTLYVAPVTVPPAMSSRAEDVHGDGRWHHSVIILAGGRWQLWVDGVLDMEMDDG